MHPPQTGGPGPPGCGASQIDTALRHHVRVEPQAPTPAAPNLPAVRQPTCCRRWSLAYQ